MKRKFLLFFIALCSSLCLGSCSSAAPEANFQLLQGDIFEGKFYPSLAIWNSAQDDCTDVFYSFSVTPPKAGAKIRIKIEETPLNEETILQVTAESAEELEITPIIKWKYEDLKQLSQNGTVTMTCVLEIDGEEIDRLNHVIKYLPVNECISAIYTGEEWETMKEMFAMFVNEDYPEIDKILQEILAVDGSRQFFDYQGSYQDVINQIYWIWEYFSNKGTRYSNVVSTSNETEYIGSQYVRFIDQTLNNNQANCVDGSALLASIYRKIGLDCYLVLVPGHCKLAISIPDDNYEDYYYYLIIETTLMGSQMSPVDSWRNAVEIYSEDDIDAFIEEEQAEFISIQQARADGIMPIPR